MCAATGDAGSLICHEGWKCRTVCPTDSGSQLSGGEFDNGLACWEPSFLQRDFFSLSSDHPSATDAPSLSVVAPAQAATELGAAGLSQRDFLLTLGHRYELSFWGRAEETRPIHVEVRQHDPPVVFLDEEISLERDWCHHQTTFDATSAGQGWLGFYIGEPQGMDNLDMIAITGPNRELLEGSGLVFHYPSPGGDMMMTGPMGLVKATLARLG